MTVSRYDRTGFYSVEGFKKLGLSHEAASQAAELANASRARRTWKLDDSVEKAIERAAAEWTTDMNFPWSEQQLLTFISHLASKNLSHSTVRQYVSIARGLHKRRSKPTEAFNSHLANALLQGLENRGTAKARERGYATPQTMWNIKRALDKSAMSVYNKRIIWFIIAAMFNAALRGSEILAEGVNKVTDKKNLKWKDIKLKETNTGNGPTKVLELTLRAPKELKGSKHVTVDIYQSSAFTDLILAYEELKKVTTLNDDRFVATWTSGKLITTNYMNKLLRKLLNKNERWEGKPITTHSFRAAIPSIMGSLGFSEDAIKRFGRWSSTAFQAYLKNGKNQRKTERMMITEHLGKIISTGIAL